MREMDNISLYVNAIDKKFGVCIFYSEERHFRFVPCVINRFGVYVPIAEGIEIPPTTDVEQIGKGYIAAAVNSLNHYGEDLDVRKAPAIYKSFKSFTSQKKFDLSHCKVVGIAKNGEIKFTYTVWHDGEFCLKKEDPIIEKNCFLNSGAAKIGNAILTVLEEARIAFPDNKILNNNK